MARTPANKRFSDTSIEVLAAGATALESHGSRPEKSWPEMLIMGHRFTRWLDTKDLTVEQIRDAADTDAFSKPTLPPALVAAFIEDVTRTCDVQNNTLRGYRNQLLGWFRGTGWNIEAAKTVVAPLVANHRFGDDFQPRRAHPALDEEVVKICDAIDSAREDTSLNPIWVEMMRTYHLVVSYGAGRGGETPATLCWGWIEDRGDELRVNTPGGNVLKYQPDPVTLTIPTHPSDPGRCPVRQLRRWKQTCVDAGIPTDDDALVFCAVKRSVLPQFATNSLEFWAGRDVVPDPMAEAAARTATPGSDDEAVAAAVFAARQHHSARFRTQWRSFAIAAGVKPDGAFERLSSHGLRRGRAMQMRANGASTVQTSHHLRHSSGASTPIYITDPQNPADPRGLYEPDGLPTIETLPPTAASVGGSGGVGGRCDPGTASEPDPVTRIEVFSALLDRDRIPPDPLADRLPGEVKAPTCELTHHGVVCGRTRDVASAVAVVHGVEVAVCSAHGQRYRKGKRGDDLSRPVLDRAPRNSAASCELDHHGVACG